MAIFSTFLFLGNIGQENVFYNILAQKKAFLGYKRRRTKIRTIDIFATFFLGDKGQSNVFYDILEPKNAFLRYKNKKFKKSKN